MLERLRNDLTTAMKARDAVTLRVLRMVLADAHNRKIAKREDLSDDEVVEVLQRGVKQRQEAAEQFENGGRQDRADDERAEIEVLRGYLPEQLDGDELAAAVHQVIADIGATSPSDMGRVMGELMSRHKGRLDGKAANAVVRDKLQNV